MASKRFGRSRRDRVLGGVCGGLAEYFDTDPSIVRLVTVLLALVAFVWPVLIVYGLAWSFVPYR